MIPDGVFCQYLSRINGGMDFYIDQKGDAYVVDDGLDEAAVAEAGTTTDSDGFTESDQREIYF